MSDNGALRKRRLEVLNRLAESDHAVIAMTARAFAAWEDADGDAETGTVGEQNDRIVKECLAALSARAAASGADPGEPTAALVEIDRRLAAAGVSVPYAGRFAATATATAVHAERTATADALSVRLADAAPIFNVGQKAICAVLTGPVGGAGAARFADRVQRVVLKRGRSCTEVRLVMRIDDDDSGLKWAEMLAAELRETGVRVIFELEKVDFFRQRPP